ncbi:PP2C family protein-serine/threonine phosphatase [Rubellimicrobium roseum]|uniref:HAMP domain-containing protein n=1 Tax=Rubellimicrobium roseum TaxID=687525 RepID=A0A5C4N7L6_9RHOB|nr:SpoIIE family protein phosphatase [Rubellimicrobium roseum]TNC66578.1 HAMP domain-containing protein [Rubellimicrobium roseum]
MSIRRTLITLFLALGAALCLAVAVQLRSSLGDYREAVDLARSNLAREHISRAALALYQERTETYLGLLGATGAPVHARESRRQSEAVLDEAARALARLRDRDALAALATLRDRVAALRGRAEAAESGPAGAAVAGIFDGYTAVVSDLRSLRLVLLGREAGADPQTSGAFRLRTHVGVLLDDLAVTRALIGGLLLSDSSGSRPSALDRAWRSANRSELAVELLESHALAVDQRLQGRINTLTSFYRTAYHPTETQVLSRLADGSSTASIDSRWNEGARQVATTAANLQETLFAISRDRLDLLRRDALRIMILWGGLLLAGVAAVAAGWRVVVHQVVAPLERLRGAMLALAEGNLAAPLPETARRDEIGVMADTLRVFKANAIRRARLQDERLALHERLQETYRLLRRDLESAAAVQAALLPAPARIGGVRFQGRLRPSNFISGDTYDVLRQPNGPVHFFVIDVAGHGAAAALVSVASHYTLTQAILRRRAGEGLAETVAGLNRDWPDHLPYFTMILGELDPEAGQGALVQSGHPPPLLLRRGGAVEPLGEGGLPIGVLPGASFDEVRFTFRPGDRLLIYSDGLSEAEDREGHPFSEERLLELVRAGAGLGPEALLGSITEALRGWRASDDLDDDMTLLMLEAIQDEHDRGDAR